MARVMVPRQRFWPPNLVGYAGALGAALSLLCSKGGQLYMAGPANREASDGSGTAPDGIGTDPIGWVRELVSGANNATQTTTAAKPKLVREPILGPELVTNGDFSDGTTGWGRLSVTTAVSGGEVTITTTVASSTAGIKQDLNGKVSSGKTYQLSGQWRAGTATANRVYARRNDGTYAGILQLPDNPTTAMRQYSGTFTLSYPDLTVVFACNATAVGQTATADNISVREILGYTDRYYWEFDGVDDSLRAASPYAGTTSGLLLCAAAAPLNRANGYVCGRGVNGVPTTPTFSLGTSGSGIRFNCGLRDDALRVVTALDLGSPPLVLGVPYIATAWLDPSGYLRLRVNGVEVANTALTHSTITLPEVSIGTRPDNAGYSALRVQSPTFTSGITTLAEVQQIERAVAQAAGVTLP